MGALTVTSFIEVNNSLAAAIPPCSTRMAVLKGLWCGRLDHAPRPVSQESLDREAIRRVKHWVYWHAKVNPVQADPIVVVEGRITVSEELCQQVLDFERVKKPFLEIKSACSSILALPKGKGSVKSFLDAVRACLNARELLTDEQVEVLKMGARLSRHFSWQHSVLDDSFRAPLAEGANVIAGVYFNGRYSSLTPRSLVEKWLPSSPIKSEDPLFENGFLLRLVARFVTRLDLCHPLFSLNDILPLECPGVSFPFVKKIVIGEFSPNADLSRDPFIALCQLIDYQGRSDHQEIELTVRGLLGDELQRAVQASFPTSFFQEEKFVETVLHEMQALVKDHLSLDKR